MYFRGETHGFPTTCFVLAGVNPKPPDDSEKVSKSNGVVGGSIHDREIISLYDEKLTRWSSVSSAPRKIKIIKIMPICVKQRLRW